MPDLYKPDDEDDVLKDIMKIVSLTVVAYVVVMLVIVAAAVFVIMKVIQAVS